MNAWIAEPGYDNDMLYDDTRGWGDSSIVSASEIAECIVCNVYWHTFTVRAEKIIII